MDFDDLRTRKIATASLWFGVSAMYACHLVVLPLAAVAVGFVALSRERRGGTVWRARVGVALGAIYLWTAGVHYVALAAAG